VLFQVLADFLEVHDGVEIDLTESVLNGGWGALDDRVELLVGVLGQCHCTKAFVQYL
jgi:hypothetical protein